MEYKGVMLNEKVMDLMGDVKLQIDPSFSVKYAQHGAHFNRTTIEAMINGAVPVATDLGMYNSNLFKKDVNYIQTFTPKGNTTTGNPRFYALFDVSNFILAPTPSDDFATELHYYYRPTSITATSDGTSWLGTNAQDAMLYGTLCEAYTFMKGDDDLFKIYLARFQESLLRLKDYGEARENSDAYRQGLVSTRRT
jgi:hypothetical protein